MSEDGSDSPLADVLFFTALQMEYAAARAAGTKGLPHDPGVEEWHLRDSKSLAPYEFGTYWLADDHSFDVALARPYGFGSSEAMNSLGVLISRLRPRWLVMSGVCAGRPGFAQFGDVIIGSSFYLPDNGKQIKDTLKPDIRTIPMNPRWVRAAEELSTADLRHYGEPSDQDARRWFLQCLQVGVNPLAARDRYLPGEKWVTALADLETDGLIRWFGPRLTITRAGRSWLQRRRIEDPGWPTQLPFKVVVGPIATVPYVVDRDDWSRLAALSSAVGLEMAGGSVASAAPIAEIDNWVVAKGVMDFATGSKNDDYKEFAAYASAEVLWKFLSERRLRDPKSFARDNKDMRTRLSVTEGILPTTSGRVDQSKQSSQGIVGARNVQLSEVSHSTIVINIAADTAEFRSPTIAPDLSHGSSAIQDARSLAVALSRLTDLLAQAGRLDEAIQQGAEAARIFRHLVQQGDSNA